ncbi:Dna-directed rna polymerase iii subunit rpc4 protein, partial [Thalictrum thalictroides]
VPVQVAFGQSSSSSYIRSYGHLKNKASRSQDANGASVKRVEKVYKEPWNYYSYYPVTVPLRRPYSGDPVDLNKKEFEQDSASIDHENMLNPARELGLMDESAEQRMLFLQLPASLPFEKPAPVETNEIPKDSKPSRPMRRPEKGCSLEELPPGFMGKMLVYKSGAVKLKLGDTIYDISPGSDCIFDQDVLAVNTAEKHCCIVGELNKRAIVTPDVDSLLQAVGDL